MLLYFLDRIFFSTKLLQQYVLYTHVCVHIQTNTTVSRLCQTHCSYHLLSKHIIIYRHSDVNVTKEDKILQTKA